MSQVGTILQAIRNTLGSGFPARTIAAELKDFGDRSHDELKAGVYTVLGDGVEVLDELDYVNVFFVGQVMVTEDTDTDADLEEAELLMLDEIYALKRAATPNIVITRINQSRRLEHPYGWIRVECRVGPYDLTPDLDESTLDPFVLFHADWDVQPFADDQQQLDWSQEDYGGGEPDAQDDVTLEQ